MGDYKVIKKEPAPLVTIDEVLWLGKHKGKTIRDIIDNEQGGPNYIRWLINQDIIELDTVGEDYLVNCQQDQEGIYPDYEDAPDFGDGRNER